MIADRTLRLLLLLSLLLPAAAARSAPEPAGARQRNFLLRHFFMGPSETSGWAEPEGRPVEPGSRVLGPFRPAYFTHEGARRRGDRTAAQLAAVDLDVRPGKALVLVGEQVVGRARAFDGLPGWLWLEPGTNRLSFLLPDGHRVSRSFELEPGSVLSLQALLD